MSGEAFSHKAKKIAQAESQSSRVGSAAEAMLRLPLTLEPNLGRIISVLSNLFDCMWRFKDFGTAGNLQVSNPFIQKCELHIYYL